MPEDDTASTSGPEAPTSQATGVIVAGGRSRRMGQPKAGLRIGDQPLLQRIASRLLMSLAKVLVIGPPELSLLVPALAILPDRHPGIGPIAGIETALQAISTDLAFVVACDMPFIQPGLISAMVRWAVDHPEADVVTLQSRRPDGSPGLEPLHAVYRRSCLPAIASRIETGSYALAELLNELHVQQFPPAAAAALDPHGLSPLNVNSPQEWARALALAGTGDTFPLDQPH